MVHMLPFYMCGSSLYGLQSLYRHGPRIEGSVFSLLVDDVGLIDLEVTLL